MIIAILWEDGRNTETKGFGPHELLLACLEDDLGMSAQQLRRSVESHPKKGSGKVRLALQRDLVRLEKSGPVLAVIDRDKINRLWPRSNPPVPNCISGIQQRFCSDAPGKYYWVLLEDNMETLVGAVCSALALPVPSTKPKPIERDEYFARAAGAKRHVRMTIRNASPSFKRTVDRVATCLTPSGG